MTEEAKRVVPKELIDSLLAGYKKPEDLIGENGLLKQLTKLLVEKALDAWSCPYKTGHSAFATSRINSLGDFSLNPLWG